MADIVVWSSLYPLFTEDTFKQRLEKTYPHVSKWFTVLRSLSEFKVSSEYHNLDTCEF